MCFGVMGNHLNLINLIYIKVRIYNIPLGFKKVGRFEKLLGFAVSPLSVTRASVSISYATTPYPSCFSKSQYNVNH